MTDDELLKLEQQLLERNDALCLKAANAIRMLRAENRILHRGYDELYEEKYGPKNVKSIYAHVPK